MNRYDDLTYVPVPEQGRLFPMLFNCGSGLADDAAGPTPEDSYLRLIKGINAQGFAEFCDTLTADGLVLVYENETPAGLFREYQSGNVCIYTYYIENEKSVRVIRDNSGSTLPQAFGVTDSPAQFNDIAMMQFALYYADMVPGTTCDCGMNYVFRLKSGAFVMVDGGEMEQATDIATEEFMRRLEGLNGGNEKITFAAWFCTHPHDDHMDFFLRLLDRYGDRIELQRVMFNFHAREYMPLGGSALRSVSYMYRLLKERYPHVLYCKLHTGQKFEFDGLTAEVLETQEDILGCHAYRNYVHGGINETSAILRFNAEGRDIILLGDAHTTNGNILVSRYAAEGLNCDFIQVAHHCINDADNVYAFTRPKNFLVPEGRYLLMSSPNNARNFRVVNDYCRPEHVFVAGDATMVWYFSEDDCKTEFFPLVGSAYDGSCRFE